MNLLSYIFSFIVLLFTSFAYAAGIEINKLPQINSVAKHYNNGVLYFTATNEGLFVSGEGHTWTRSFESLMPATMVVETGNGDLYAFILSEGLVKYDNASRQWRQIYNQFGSQVLLNLSGNSKSPKS